MSSVPKSSSRGQAGKPISPRMARHLARIKDRDRDGNSQKTATSRAHAHDTRQAKQKSATNRAQDFSDNSDISGTSQRLSKDNTGCAVAEYRNDTRRCFDSEISEGKPSTLALEQYVCHAAELWRGNGGEDQGHRGIADATALFGFIQITRGHPDLLMAGTKVAWRLINDIVSSWQFGGATGWDYFGVDAVDAESEFFDCWHRIKSPGKLPLLTIALLRAKSHGVKLRIEVALERPDDYQRFIGFCAWLQVSRGREAIILPVRKVGEALGVSADTAGRYIRWGIADGYLCLENESKGHIKAAEYKFGLTLFPDLAASGGCVKEHVPDEDQK